MFEYVNEYLSRPNNRQTPALTYRAQQKINIQLTKIISKRWGCKFFGHLILPQFFWKFPLKLPSFFCMINEIIEKKTPTLRTEKWTVGLTEHLPFAETLNDKKCNTRRLKCEQKCN